MKLGNMILDVSHCRIWVAISVVVVLVAVSFLALSCGDTGTQGEVKNKYVINGLLARNASVANVGALLEITRNGVSFSSALVKLEAPAGDNADPIYLGLAGDGVFRQNMLPGALHDTSIFRVSSLVDAFQFSFQLSLPKAFSAEVVGLPYNRVLGSTENVQVRWSLSDFEDGYLIVVKPADAGGTAVGLSKILTAQDISEDPPFLTTLIPREAFRNSQREFQAGDYNVWIAAYHDDPIDDGSLPFTLPTGFASNVTPPGVTGQIGAIYIAQKTVLTAVATF